MLLVHLITCAHAMHAVRREAEKKQQVRASRTKRESMLDRSIRKRGPASKNNLLAIQVWCHGYKVGHIYETLGIGGVVIVSCTC